MLCRGGNPTLLRQIVDLLMKQRQDITIIKQRLRSIQDDDNTINNINLSKVTIPANGSVSSI
jgi:hypothetical protein